MGPDTTNASSPLACEPCSLTAAAEYVAGIVTADVRAEMERAA